MESDFRDLFGDWRPDEDRPSIPEGGSPEPENRGRRALNEKEVKVVNVWEGVVPAATIGGQVSVGLGAPSYFVLLRDNSGREFRIFVLREMAYSIQLALERESSDRPFTHDLMKAVLDRLGAQVERVTIDDLWQDTFYARITLSRGEETMDVDARPSDAIALALRFKAPIYAAESVLEAAQHESGS